MITLSSDKPAHGIGDPIVWSLLLCAFGVAVGAFILLRERSLEPVGGFGGPGSDRGFPVQVGEYKLRRVKQIDATATRASYLAATYQKGLSTPQILEYYPIPADTDGRKWFDAQLAAEKERGASIEREGAVRAVPTAEVKNPEREGSYAVLKGVRAGDPTKIIWNQRIGDTKAGFILIAPNSGQALDLRSQFRRESPPPTTPSS
ncbi:MAG: hypothetical protein Fur0032_10900 [Terrimicrobiaceae bacterium]